MAKYTIWTDGACAVHGNKCGGVGVRIFNGEYHVLDLADHYCNTTNNKMELEAVIVALQHTPAKAEITIWTDSMYVVGHANGFYKGKSNPELWRDYWHLAQHRTIEVKHCKRNTKPDQTAADALSKKGVQKCPNKPARNVSETTE